jgi:hypothetical protein
MIAVVHLPPRRFAQGEFYDHGHQESGQADDKKRDTPAEKLIDPAA